MKFFSRSREERMPCSVADKALDAVSGGLTAVIAILSVVFWQVSEDAMPIHFNAVGQADAWGEPFHYLIIGGISVLIWMIGMYGARYPQYVNLPVAIRPGRATVQNRMKCRYLRIILIALSILFVCLLLKCRAVQTDAAWEAVASSGFFASLVAVLLLTVAATVHVNRIGRR